MQSAISGHWSQSIGTDLSGQHGMPAAISVAAISAIGAAMPGVMPAFAGAESGANTRLAIKKIASSRARWIEVFTAPISHNPAVWGTSAGSLIRLNPAMDGLICLKWSIISGSLQRPDRQIMIAR
jgi:hypothetical protein